MEISELRKKIFREGGQTLSSLINDNFYVSQSTDASSDNLILLLDEIPVSIYEIPELISILLLKEEYLFKASSSNGLLKCLNLILKHAQIDKASAGRLRLAISRNFDYYERSGLNIRGDIFNTLCKSSSSNILTVQDDIESVDAIVSCKNISIFVYLNF